MDLQDQIVDLELGIVNTPDFHQISSEPEAPEICDADHAPAIKYLDPDLVKLKFRILHRLVVQLQSRWRGGKARELVRPRLIKLREAKARRIKFLEILTKEQEDPIVLPEIAANVVESSKEDATSDISDISERIEVKVPDVFVSPIEDPMEQLLVQVSRLNQIKSRILGFLSQRILARRLALHLVEEAAPLEVGVSEDEIAEESEFEVESVDLYLPKNEPEPVVDWEVQEVTDMNRYEIQFERLRFAATKIQRFYRRFLTRRKFEAYMNEKTLTTVWAEKEELTQAAEERGETPPAFEEVIAQDAINTEGCPVM